MSAWILAGSPNSGKTTLYNWLTGSKFKTVNYPGATVEYSVGQLHAHLSESAMGYSPVVIDTPGIYSLFAQSEDEQVTYSTLFVKKADQKKINGVICVVDGTQLARHLVLAQQIKDSGYPVILVVTMADILKKNNIQLHLEKFKAEMSSKVIFFDGLLGAGLHDVVTAMKECDEENLSRVIKVRVPDTSPEAHQLLMRTIQKVVDRITTTKVKDHSVTKMTRAIDKILLHPILGIAFFFLFMTLLFSSIYWLAAPAMEIIDTSFGWLSETVTEAVPGLFGNFLGKGLVAAIGGVVIFIPQIFILFFGIGILESSGTALDRSLYISLEGMEAIHVDWQSGAAPQKGHEVSSEQITAEMLIPKGITAFFIRAKSKIQVLQLQRTINEFADEALLAVIPGVVLSEFWQTLSQVELIFKIISALVMIVGLIGMLISILTSINERRREMAILRALGAGLNDLMAMIVLEVGFILLAAVGSACVIKVFVELLFLKIIEKKTGLIFEGSSFSGSEAMMIGLTLLCGILFAMYPAWQAKRKALKDGLTVKV